MFSPLYPYPLLTGLVSPPVGKTTNQEKETGDTCTRQTIPEIWGAKITHFHIIDNKLVSKTSERGRTFRKTGKP